MNGKSKKFVAVIALILAILMIVPSLIMALSGVQAANSLDEAKQATKEAKDKVYTAKLKKNEAQAKLNAIDAELNTIAANINNIEANIAQLDADIEAKTVEIEEKTAILEEKQVIYDQRIAVVYEQGAGGYISILFESDNLYDMFDRYELMNQLVSYDKEIIDDVAATKKELETAKADLEASKKERETELATQKQQQTAYEEKQTEAQAVLNALAQDLAEYEALLASAQAEQDRIQAQIAARTAGKSGKSYIGTGNLTWPCPGYTTITSQFGPRTHPVTGKYTNHSGTDISAPTGASILAAASGTVIMAGYNAGGYGNYVVIDHGGGVTTLYAHASSLNVSTGQFVTQGQVIAKVGSTGMSTGPHLHLEVQVNGQRQDAMSYFR